MESRCVTVGCESGLHQKQAVYFVQKANEFQSNLWVEYGNVKLNAKSLLGVLQMGLLFGQKPIISAEGPDATAALDSLEDLLQHDVCI